MATSNIAQPTRTEVGRVLFAYDGSDLAKRAIEEASRLVGPGTTRSC